MTPKEYQVIQAEQIAIIDHARMIILKARQKADKSPFPRNVRPAEPKDIVEGQIIWHRNVDSGCSYWNIVDKVLHPNDPFKAYCADDGCRYGLDCAFIEI